MKRWLIPQPVMNAAPSAPGASLRDAHNTPWSLLAIGVLISTLALGACNPLNTIPTQPRVLPEHGYQRVAPLQIGADRQLAVRNEFWYALDPNWLQVTNDSNGPTGISVAGLSGLSRWNYISSSADANSHALQFVLGTYGGFVSNLIPGIGGNLNTSEVAYWAGRLSSDAYGLDYGAVRGAGHGCQCVAFVAMGLYRALGGYRMPSWNWASLDPAAFPAATTARPGDLVFYKTDGTHGHVGACVRNDGTKITVVDSNYIGGDGSELIARHDVSYAAIGSKWKTYSGRGKWY